MIQSGPFNSITWKIFSTLVSQIENLRLADKNNAIVKLNNNCCKPKKSLGGKCQFQGSIWGFHNLDLCNFFLVPVRMRFVDIF